MSNGSRGVKGDLAFWQDGHLITLPEGIWGLYIPAHVVVEMVFRPVELIIPIYTSLSAPPEVWSNEALVFPLTSPTLPEKEKFIFDLLRQNFHRGLVINVSIRAIDKRIIRTKEILSENIQNPIKIQDIARELQINRETLSRSFRQAFRLSPMEYLQAIRQDEFIKLNQFGQNTVLESCLEAGFSDVSSFSHTFRKNYHVSPSMYLNQPLEKIDRT